MSSFDAEASIDLRPYIKNRGSFSKDLPVAEDTVAKMQPLIHLTTCN